LQNQPTRLRVEEEGESQCRPVMGRTGIEPCGKIIPLRKQADFPLVSADVNSQQTGVGSDAEMSARS